MSINKKLSNTDANNTVNNKVTPGSIQRSKDENSRSQKKTTQQIQKANTIFSKQIKEEILGSYKRVVIDSFIRTFDERYGDSFDYTSLVSALNFSIKEDKNGLSPDFSFKENNIEFKSDAKKECVNFNENAREEFISNDDVISGNLNIKNKFNTSEEFEAYQNGDKNYSEIEALDAQFIPTTNAERYGEFNKINKIAGYSPVEQTGKDAIVESKKVWDKIAKKVLSIVIKKNNKL